jgi:hypothetical protein
VALPALLTAQNPRTEPRAHAPQPTTAAITAEDLRTRLYIFAADSMEGRETGRRGQMRATDYIAAQLKSLGLEPMGDSGTYFQNVPVIRRILDSSSTITAPGVALVAGRDFVAFGEGRTRANPADATIIYAGAIGDGAPELAPEVVRGKLVVYYKASASPPSPADPAWDVLIVDRLRDDEVRHDLRDGDIQLRNSPADSGSILSRAAAERLFGAPLEKVARGTTKTVRLDNRFIDEVAPARNVIAAYRGNDPILRNEWVAFGAHNDHLGIIAGLPVDHDSLHLYAKAAYPIRERIARYSRENHICGNRAAPGPTASIEGYTSQCAQPTPAQQAHFDSLNAQIATMRVNLDSVRKANGGIRLDSISNGADDDGSGAVALLEIAEKFAATRATTKRSLLFVWHTGEEKGLWGSRYLANHSPVPLDSIVTQINLDMIGRGGAGDLAEGGPDYLQLVGTRRQSTELGDIVEMVNKQQAQPFAFDYSFDAEGHPERYYCRSDNFNYGRYGIPVVYVRTGNHGDYHEVTDEPEYIDYDHLARIGNFVFTFGSYIANIDHRPKVDKPVPNPRALCR